MSEYFQLFVTEETINAATASRKGLLDVPTDEENPTLYQKSADESKWREMFEVKDTNLKPSKDDPKVAVFTVQYRVTEECPYEKNIGKVMTKFYYVHLDALKDPNHEERKRAMMNIGKLHSLIRGCGMDVAVDDNGRVPYHIYFNGEEGGEKPLVGVKFWGVVRAYKYKSRKTNEMVSDQDIDSFIPMEA